MIAAHRLTKTYGTRTAVDGISLTVAHGRVTGFLGPNGAGKSTTMRMVLGLDRPTSGSVTVNGRRYADLDQLAISTQCGFASEAQGNLLTEDDQWRKLDLVARVADRVWGS